MTSAANTWAEHLGEWGIPAPILEAAPQSPWIHPVANFRPTGDLFVDTPSRHRALEAIPPGGSVLDVGCGGGRAAFGLTPPATSVVGVDHQQVMLDTFAAEAARRRIRVDTHLGDWPAVAAAVPPCDVVTCHHVLYNVPDLEPFVAALAAAARRRVVVEIPQHHPLASLSPAWVHFWGLVRPIGPTSEDALDVVRAMGIDAHLEHFVTTPPVTSPAVNDRDVEHTRIRLCLPAARDPEVKAFLTAQRPQGRHLTAIWWNA